MGFVGRSLLSGITATLGTTAGSAILGKVEKGHAAAPLNATSHIVWDEEAFSQNDVSVRYTLVGAALNAGAMFGWAALQELALGRWVRSGPAGRAAISGVVTSAVAYATDYRLVPERLTPGFERRLSKPALAATYGILAVCLAFGIHRSR